MFRGIGATVTYLSEFTKQKVGNDNSAPNIISLCTIKYSLTFIFGILLSHGFGYSREGTDHLLLPRCFYKDESAIKTK